MEALQNLYNNLTVQFASVSYGYYSDLWYSDKNMNFSAESE